MDCMQERPLLAILNPDNANEMETFSVFFEKPKNLPLLHRVTIQEIKDNVDLAPQLTW